MSWAERMKQNSLEQRRILQEKADMMDNEPNYSVQKNKMMNNNE